MIVSDFVFFVFFVDKCLYRRNVKWIWSCLTDFPDLFESNVGVVWSQLPMEMNYKGKEYIIKCTLYFWVKLFYKYSASLTLLLEVLIVFFMIYLNLALCFFPCTLTIIPVHANENYLNSMISPLLHLILVGNVFRILCTIIFQ